MFTLSYGDLSFTVDRRIGARVTSFQLGGTEVLTDASVNADNWGSTLWTSPQADWGWPPITGLDSGNYTLPSIGGTDPSFALRSPTINFTSLVNGRDNFNFRAIKTFTMEDDGAVAIEYCIYNDSLTAARLAAWEVTRVPAGGLSFFAGTNYGHTSLGPLDTTTVGGMVWFDHAGGFTGNKIFADGSEGWLAHVIRVGSGDDLLFVKSWTDVPAGQQAVGVPGSGDEGEVEVYAAGNYVELEVQGPFVDIAAFTMGCFTVRWRLVALPGGTTVSPGQDLVDRARALAGP